MELELASSPSTPKCRRFARARATARRVADLDILPHDISGNWIFGVGVVSVIRHPGPLGGVAYAECLVRPFLSGYLGQRAVLIILHVPDAFSLHHCSSALSIHDNPHVA